MSKRDDFTSKTKEILAKRVGFLCSNPTCNKHTVGPNSDEEKATSIGVAAHITAASVGGPRYDENLLEAERTYIKNGIWLCSSCSVLIDRDVERFPTELLIEWKTKAEDKIKAALEGKILNAINPFLEADLIWDFRSRIHNGYSSKNIEVFDQPIPAGTDLYVHWSLKWVFKFTIHNNSEVPAYNLSLNIIDDKQFSYIEELPKINNIQPFQSTEIEARYVRYFHGTSAEADKELTPIPKNLLGMKMELLYKDNERNEHGTIVEMDANGLNNVRK